MHELVFCCFRVQHVCCYNMRCIYFFRVVLEHRAHVLLFKNIVCCHKHTGLRGNSVVPEIFSLPPSRTSFTDPTQSTSSPESPVTQLTPHHLVPRAKEERSQSTGQILRERSGGIQQLPLNVIADLARLCPFSLSDVQEEEEEMNEGREEEEADFDGVMDAELTPVPHRRLSPCTPSPQYSPLPRRRLAMVTDGDEAATTLRRGSSHSSLIGGLPPSLLPTLPTSTSKLSLGGLRVDSSMSMTDSGWPITKSLFQVRRFPNYYNNVEIVSIVRLMAY